MKKTVDQVLEINCQYADMQENWLCRAVSDDLMEQDEPVDLPKQNKCCSRAGHPGVLCSEIDAAAAAAAAAGAPGVRPRPARRGEVEGEDGTLLAKERRKKKEGGKTRTQKRKTEKKRRANNPPAIFPLGPAKKRRSEQDGGRPFWHAAYRCGRGRGTFG